MYMRVLFLCLCLSFSGFAQTMELEKFSKAKLLRVNGGLNANAVYTQGMPLNYFLAGNLNFSLMRGLNIPLNFNYSDRKVTLSQGYSFNQISVHPSYKWANAHLGTTSMSFSPYTLNGHQFTGAGVELSPGRWKIQAMHGRLVKGQRQDTLNTGPTFTRTGFAYFLEYRASKWSLGTTLLKAKDRDASLDPEYRRFKGQVLHPSENTVAGIQGSFTLYHALQFSGEYANSLITKERSEAYKTIRGHSLAAIFQESNATTESSHALKLKMTYHQRSSGTLLGLGYERVDPNYRTFGGYYFVNDLINYTLNFNQTFKKYQVGGNLGLQQDDIRKEKMNKQSRFVANIKAQAQFNEKLSMGVNFSNFRSYRFVNDTYTRLERIPNEVIDTLNHAMVSQNLGYTYLHKLKVTEEKVLSLSLNSSFLATHQALGEEELQRSNILNSVLTFSLERPQRRASSQVSLSHFYNRLPENPISGIGPVLGWQKSLYEKVQLSVSCSLLQIKNLQNKQAYTSTNAQGNAVWNVNKRNRFQVNAGFVQNRSNTFFNGNIGYNLSFN